MYTSVYRNEERFGFSTKGSFSAPRDSERIRIILAVIILIVVLVAFYNMNLEEIVAYAKFFTDSSGVFYTGHLSAFGLEYMVFSIIFVIIDFSYIVVTMKGIKVDFSADERIFSIWSKKGGIKKTDILYKDVVAVAYEENKLFGVIPRGLTVTIITHSLGNVTVNYLFPKGTTVKTPQNTPFHIIEERMDMLGSGECSQPLDY